MFRLGRGDVTERVLEFLSQRFPKMLSGEPCIVTCCGQRRGQLRLSEWKLKTRNEVAMTTPELITDHTTFHYEFDVSSPLADVIDFHRAPGAFRKLTPPPIFIQEVQVLFWYSDLAAF